MFQKFSVSEKIDGYEGGGEYQDFPSKSLCLTVPKIFVGDSFSVSLSLGIEIKLGIRERERERERERGITIFLRYFFVSQYRNLSQWNPSVYH